MLIAFTSALATVRIYTDFRLHILLQFYYTTIPGLSPDVHIRADFHLPTHLRLCFTTVFTLTPPSTTSTYALTFTAAPTHIYTMSIDPVPRSPLPSPIFTYVQTSTSMPPYSYAITLVPTHQGRTLGNQFSRSASLGQAFLVELIKRPRRGWTGKREMVL